MINIFLIEHEGKDGCLFADGRAFRNRVDAESALLHVGYCPSSSDEDFYVNSKFGKKDNMVGAYIRQIELME